MVMVLVLVVGVLSFVVRLWRLDALAQEAVVERIRSRRGIVVFDYQRDGNGTVSRWIPDSLFELLGPHYLAMWSKYASKRTMPFPRESRTVTLRRSFP